MAGGGSFCFGVFLVFKKFFCWCCFGGFFFFYFHRHSFLPVIRGHQARESGSGSSQAMFSVFWMVHTGMAWSTVLGLSKYSSRGRWEMSRKEFLLFPFVNVFLLSIRLLRVLRVTEKNQNMSFSTRPLSDSMHFQTNKCLIYYEINRLQWHCI